MLCVLWSRVTNTKGTSNLDNQNQTYFCVPINRRHVILFVFATPGSSLATDAPSAWIWEKNHMPTVYQDTKTGLIFNVQLGSNLCMKYSTLEFICLSVVKHDFVCGVSLQGKLNQTNFQKGKWFKEYIKCSSPNPIFLEKNRIFFLTY